MATVLKEAPALEVEKVRQDFPILQRTINGRPLVYLDSAASSQRPRAVLRAVFELAVAAQAAQFDDLMTHLKAVRGRIRGQRRSEFPALDFERRAAFVADEELAFVGLAGIAARDERVLRLDAMHEAVFDEEVQRAIDGRGRHARAAFGLHRVDEVVGADRLVRLQDEFVDVATQRRQREAALIGERFGAGEHGFDGRGHVVVAVGGGVSIELSR